MNLAAFLAETQMFYTPPSPWPLRLKIGGILLIGAVVKYLYQKANEPTSPRNPPIAPSSSSPIMPSPPVVAEGLPTPPVTSPIGVLVAGYVCGIVSLLFFPPFLGLAGIICGVVAIKRGVAGHGFAIIILSFVCAMIGLFIGMAS